MSGYRQQAEACWPSARHGTTEDMKSSVQDTKLFETILGIQAPWHIARVALETSGDCVDLSAEHADDTADAAPSATGSCPWRDHADERVRRHLDTCQYHTLLDARVPRVDCPTHGVRRGRRPLRDPFARTSPGGPGLYLKGPQVFARHWRTYHNRRNRPLSDAVSC